MREEEVIIGIVHLQVFLLVLRTIPRVFTVLISIWVLQCNETQEIEVRRMVYKKIL
jgi:hypothetical protein